MRYFKTRIRDDVDHVIHFASESEPWVIHEVSSNYHVSDQQAANKGYLKIQISDTGCGIAANQIPNLFKMFAQAHKSVNTMHGGTGLGLWICKQLCQRMGGDIKLYSELKRGTSFVLYVPIDNSQTWLPLRSGAIASRRELNVLIVDDFAHNRELHRLLIEREGAQAVLASDGNEAMRKFQAHEEGFFSFVMMDVLMPEVNGFQAARMIREWEARENRSKKS